MKPTNKTPLNLKTTLIAGDPIAPDSTDLLAITLKLPVSESPRALIVMTYPPKGEHWRILMGNMRWNTWGAIAYRYEIQAAYPNAFGRSDREDSLLKRLKEMKEAADAYIDAYLKAGPEADELIRAGYLAREAIAEVEGKR